MYLTNFKTIIPSLPQQTYVYQRLYLYRVFGFHRWHWQSIQAFVIRKLNISTSLHQKKNNIKHKKKHKRQIHLSLFLFFLCFIVALLLLYVFQFAMEKRLNIYLIHKLSSFFSITIDY